MTRRLGRGAVEMSPHGDKFLSLRGLKASKVRTESPLVRPQAQTFFSRWGLTRRLRRGWWDLQSQGAFILFFRWRKKSMQKKASGTATPGKRLLLPILTAGLATSRASKRASYLQRSCALLCSPFSAVKMGGPFSLRCLSPLCSAAVGAGQTQMAVLGMLRCGLDGFAAQKNRLVFLTRLAMHILGPCQLGCFVVA